MNISRLNILLLASIVLFFTLTNCRRNQNEIQNDKDSLGIKFHLFNEKYNNNQNLQILDTRTMDEYKSGHIPGALILPVQDLESAKDVSSILSNFKKNEEVYIYCTAGGPRSQRATKILRTLGFKKAYFVEGGIAKWIASGNPIE
ncbi:rhodanese-like domain-containing protein [Desulfobacterota bacterium AH_259_B03_O07]|nr:rhodanese-like domain-containing protein [Desulfobacterota bacterium AH_259_B03_O07]